MQFAKLVAEQMRTSLPALYDQGPAVSTYDMTRLWISFARQYLSASEVLHGRDSPLILPWIQISGHAMECSLKSFLCASGERVPRDHDLVVLLDVAQRVGLVIEDKDTAMLVHLNHLYSRGMHTPTRYKARFPSDRWEFIGGTIPEQDFLKRIVQDICNQAVGVNERNRVK
ncbi:MAG: HEPN domain-containing protein [Pseudomonadota bacterium]